MALLNHGIVLKQSPISCQAVDGVLTDDNDAFLYGALTVYCDLCANEKVLFTTTLNGVCSVQFKSTG